MYVQMLDIYIEKIENIEKIWYFSKMSRYFPTLLINYTCNVVI